MPTGLGGEKLWLCPTLEGENLDLSGNGNHGTYYGGMGTVVDKYKGSRAFDFYSSSNQYVSVPTLDMRNLTQFSWSAWIRNTRVTGINTIFFSSSSSGGSEYLYDNFIFFRNRSTGRARTAVDNNSEAYGDGGVFPNDVWNHAAVVFDGNGSTNSQRLRYFLNGQEVSMTYNYTVPSVTPNRATTNVLIGGYAYNLNASNAMDGQQDDIRVFKRTLTPVEIKHLASKRGVLGSPHYSPITLKSRITKLVSDRDDSIKPNLLSINKPKRSEPSYKSGYAKSASESASPHLWDGLVGAWMPSLGVTGDTLRDVSGNDNHGTLTNMGGSNWGPSYLNYAGTNQSVLVDSIEERQSGEPRTVCAWFRGNYQPNNYNVITGQWFNNQQNFGIWIRDRENIDFFIGGSIYTDGSISLTGKWQFAAMTVEGGLDGIVKTYIDAKQTRQFNQGALNETGTQEWSIGCRTLTGTVNDRFFVGDIGSVVLHNRALSPQEIQELYVDSLAPFRQKSIRIFGGVGIPTDTSKIITVKRSKHVEPSYKSGYAQSAGESAHPNLWDGLVGAWMPSMGVTGKTLRDVSRNGNHGTLTGMDAATDWVTSEKGLALDFDGVDDYVRMVTPLSISTHPFNVSVSLKRFDTTLYPRLFDISDNTYQFQAVLDIAGNGQLKTKHTKWQPNSNSTSTTWGFIPTLNQFEVISVNVYPSTNETSLYRNGIAQSGSSSNNVNTGANSNLTFLGCRRDLPGFSFMDGQFGFFHIYNRALTPDEIQTLYVDSLAPFRKKQQVAFNAYPLTLLQKIRSAAKPTTPVSVRVKHNEEPSYKAGYAKSADESASPRLWNGLVGAWMPSLGVTGNQLRDASGNGNHGTLTGMDAATDWVASSKGLALDFDGVNDYVDCGNVDLRNNKTFTLSIISKYKVLQSGVYYTFFSAGGFTAGGWLFQRNGANNKLRFAWNGVSWVDTNKTFATTGTWINLVLTVEDRIARSIHINGSLWDTFPVANATFSSKNDVEINRRSDSASQYTNAITSSVQLYNRALSPQEIQELYVDSLAPFRRKKSPIGYQPNKELRGLFKV